MFLQECALQFEVCLRLVLPIPHPLPIGISYAIFLKFTILNLNKEKLRDIACREVEIEMFRKYSEFYG